MALLCCLLPLVLSCGARTTATVINTSPAVLSEVVVSGEGFHVDLGTLQPGERRKVSLPLASSEHGFLDVRFRVAGTPHHSRQPAYFETRGYELSVTVHPDLSVSTAIQLAPVS